MQEHFTYGHTIEPIEIEESSSNLEDLFKIGNESIKMETKKQQPILISDSDETPQHHKQGKKIKKKKKKKDRHRSRSQEKKRKHKHSKRTPSSSEQKGKIVAILEPHHKQKTMNITERELQIRVLKASLMNIADEQKQLTSQFELNKKIGEGLLKIDIVPFPSKQLYSYGLMDKDIPRYKRLPQFNSIVGSKSKKQKQINKLINKKINQKSSSLNNDQLSKHRYYHFEGYQQLLPEKLPSARPLSTQTLFIPLGATQTFYITSQHDSLLKINRQYNGRLNEQPKNIDLWLQFYQLQENNQELSKSAKNKGAILDRQLSIIEKALQANPLNPKLAIVYLNIISQKQTDSTFISQKCLEFIRAHPDSAPLWKIYLSLQIGQFNLYSHEFARKVFEELTHLQRSFIDTTRSAIQLWKIRKASLQLLNRMITIQKLEGYGELATGLIVALIDFNFFMPESVIKMSNHQQRVKAFETYWQNHAIYKLGQICSNVGWDQQNHSKLNESSQQIRFIGQLMQAFTPTTQSHYLNELEMDKYAWRPSHPLRQKNILLQRQESFILIQDIDFSLHLYRDSDSLAKLLDLLAQNLQLPLIFSFKGYHSQFGFSLVQQSLLKKEKTNQKQQFRQQFYWWRRFWNPSQSHYVLEPSKFPKIQYLRRILQSVKAKLPSCQELIDQYLVFINCCYYSNKVLRQSVQLTEEQVSSDLQILLGQSNLNIGAWCMYVETTFLLKQNLQECLACYLQLLEAAKALSQQSISHSKEIQIIFWLWKFAAMHSSSKHQSLLKMLLNIWDSAKEEQLSFSNELLKNEENRLERYFKQKLSVLQNKLPQNKTTSQDTYLLLLAINLADHPSLKGLTSYKQSISSFLLSFVMNSQNQLQQHFLLYFLSEQKLLSKTNLIEKRMLSRFPYIEIVQYWININLQPLVTLIAELSLLKQLQLSLWLVCCMLLRLSQRGFQQQALTTAKRICFSGKQYQQFPHFVILLGNLLIRDVNAQHRQFLQYALKQLPYAKQIYFQNLLVASGKGECRKITSLMKQKGIRILQKQLTEE